MAKKPVEKIEDHQPKLTQTCGTCKFSEPWHDLIYCSFKAPAHFNIDPHHKARLVHTLNSCSLYQPKQ